MTPVGSTNSDTPQQLQEFEQFLRELGLSERETDLVLDLFGWSVYRVGNRPPDPWSAHDVLNVREHPTVKAFGDILRNCLMGRDVYEKFRLSACEDAGRLCGLGAASALLLKRLLCCLTHDEESGWRAAYGYQTPDLVLPVVRRVVSTLLEARRSSLAAAVEKEKKRA